MALAVLGDTEIFYETHGEGEPLILMAGVGQWHQFWYRNLPDLAKHFRVVWFDNRGIGLSSKPDVPYDIPMFESDLLGLLDHLEVDRAHLVGHSLGGLVSLTLAMQHPERVGKLVAISTLYPGPNFVPWTEAAGALLFDRGGDPVEVVRRGVRVSTAPGFAERDPETAEKLMWLRFNSQQSGQLYLRQSMAGAEYLKEDHMREIPNPVLLLYGDHDEVVPPANGRLIAEKLPNATVQIIEGAGHMLPLERPTETSAAIIEFLKPGATMAREGE